MGKQNSISVEDLMGDLGISDWKHFQRLIKNNQLPQVSRDKSIPRQDADKIALELRGRRVNWYNLKQVGRDIDTGGPLHRKYFPEISNQLEIWYSKLDTHKVGGEISQLPILGIVCSGGFLRGQSSTDDDPFILPTQIGINVFIGDRGSGKSTALSMLTLLSDSTSERTDVLVKVVLDLLQGKQDTASNWSRRIWNTLRQYGVKTYACYFHRAEKVYVFYVDTVREGYDILHRKNDGWISLDVNLDTILPKMQVLRQGDVFRIADDDEQLVFNNILDGLYPNLYEQRKKLAHQLSSLASHYKEIRKKIHRLRVDRQGIDSFLSYYPQRLRDLESLAQSSRNSIPQVLNEIESYIQEYDRVDMLLAEGSIYELLQSGREAMFCLYVGRISRVLREKISIVRHLLENDTLLIDQSKSSEYNSNEILTDKSYGQEKQDLISQAISEVFRFLKNRLPSVLHIWKYFHNLSEWNEKLSELSQQYISFLQSQSRLIEDQEYYCKQISEVLRQENSDTHLFTYKADILLNQNRELSEELKRCEEYFRFLMEADIGIPKRELLDAYKNYDNAIGKMFKDLEKIGDSDTSIEANKDFVFHPIRVELRQGNSYRSFEQLSFGQKSGIILMIALWMTKADIVVIDQPEDNLDSQSIIYMLAPTLLRVSKDRSIIIATHNSNLIMGLGRSNLSLFVMESREDYGRIRVFGNLLNETVVRQMLDVLEGGVGTFEEKWRLYEEFVNLFPSDIQNTDIALIESSYRRRTIDNLRNYLQPVVSDRFILTSLRHELKNLEQNRQMRLQQDLYAVKCEIEQCRTDTLPELKNFLQQLDLLLSNLDRHLSRVTEAIEQIRRMDTQPHPTEFEIYPLLLEEIESISHHEVNFNLSEMLKSIKIYADKDHTRLVFNNLFKNAVRATEKKAAEYLVEDSDEEYMQTIVINVIEVNPLSIALQMFDNGIGLLPNVRKRLYVERCSTQQGEEHGYGGIIIRKLLDLNGGAIQVVDTQYGGIGSLTIQKITLPTGSK
jgi:ABC-type lipoprotein export system ATPase subunit